MAEASLKARIYPQFARIAQALASERRLELVDLLAQAPRHVEALAIESGMSVANVSQHLQVLKAVHLVESEREGTRTIYRLAGPDVTRLCLAMRTVGEGRLPEIDRIVAEFEVGEIGTTMRTEEVDRLMRAGSITLIDVRPTIEFEAGHVPGAVSVPPEDLAEALATLPRDRTIVAYCRGAYCLMADEAVAVLRREGFEAYRMEGGWPEWSIGKVSLGS
jgi:rhodanese-related sulfurtransferase